MFKNSEMMNVPMGIRKPFMMSVPNANINPKKKSVSLRNRTPKVVNVLEV